MTDGAPEVEVVHQPERNRFQILVDGSPIGMSTYRDEPGRRVFLHTEVDVAQEGKGYGRRLATDALDSTRAAGLQVRPLCPFIASFIRRNRQYADLLAAD
jgi:predicted GNAT family acetyltransferase